MADEVYYPIEIPDTPLPNQEQLQLGGTNPQTANGNLTQTTIPDNGLPKRIVARETISEVLNTQTRKILGELGFTKMGAIQIGEFSNGFSGDIRISPNGFLARDLTGRTTVAIDGDTGDATFAGLVRGGSFLGVNGNVAIEEASDGSGRIVLYNGGLASVVIGNPN